MKPRRVSLGESTFQPVEVDLWGRVFQTRRVTRTVSKQVRELYARVDAATDEDQAFAACAELLTVLLAPMDGKRKTAGAVVTAKWNADELTIDDLTRFAERLRDVKAGRAVDG